MNGEAYASFADFDEELSRAETNPRIRTRIESALVTATEKLTQELELDFFRHPSTGTETRLFHADGSGLIHAHEGIVSVDLIRIRTSRFSDWVELVGTDFDLEAWSTSNATQAAATNEPYDHLWLNGTGSYSFFPRGKRLVEIEGVFGWPNIPRLAIDANVDWARQDMAADRTYPGGVQVPAENGFQPQRLPLPDSVYRLKRWSLERFACAT